MYTCFSSILAPQGMPSSATWKQRKNKTPERTAISCTPLTRAQCIDMCHVSHICLLGTYRIRYSATFYFSEYVSFISQTDPKSFSEACLSPPLSTQTPACLWFLSRVGNSNPFAGRLDRNLWCSRQTCGSLIHIYINFVRRSGQFLCGRKDHSAPLRSTALY